MTASKRPASVEPAKRIIVLRRGKYPDIISGTIEINLGKDTPEIGEIVAIGLGKQPIEMKIGDVIAYRRFGESKIYVGGKELLFVSFQDILAVLKRGGKNRK